VTAAWTSIVAQPSLVAMNVRVDPRVTDLDAVAEAVDGFDNERCETCGFDVEDHVVTPGPFGKPFLYCEKGDGR
jgi:hypothetical protein